MLYEAKNKQIRGCSFFTLHTRSESSRPGYETFPGVVLPGMKHFANMFMGERNIFNKDEEILAQI